MDISETTLPGVGKKHELELKTGDRVVVLTHNSGRRELLRKPTEDADPERLLELTDQEARILGTTLEGAYFQPVESGDDATMFADDRMLDWIDFTEQSSIVGDEVGAIPEDVIVLAIHRDGELLTGTPPETTFEPGDTVVIAGTRDAVVEFEDRASDEA